MSELDKIIETSAQCITAHLDSKILEFFGSAEEAERIGHLFVLESYPVVLKTSGETNGLAYMVQMETHYRFRPKTAAELEDERLERLDKLGWHR